MARIEAPTANSTSACAMDVYTQCDHYTITMSDEEKQEAELELTKVVCLLGLTL